MRLMDLLRRRVFMVGLAVAVAVGMVATGAIGLFNALSAPDAPPQGQAAPPGNAASPVSAPKLDTLGEAPKDTSYTDFGEQCPDVECVRIVGIATEDGGGKGKISDEETEAAIETVYNHLLDDGWARVLPDNEADPDEVPLSESYLTDGTVMITATPVNAPDASAGLMLMHAQQPDS